MKAAARLRRSHRRMFASYAAIALVTVLLLGAVLAYSFRGSADRRGLAEGLSEARLVARTAVEPLLEGHQLDRGISNDERTGLRRLTATRAAQRDVLRLRVRDLSGQVVFSDDGSGFGERPEDEALDAASGHAVTRL